MKAKLDVTKRSSIKKANFVNIYNDPKTLGNITHTCEQVGIPRKTYYSWLETDESFREAIKESKMRQCDIAESTLYDRGLTRDTGALIFWLKNRHPDFKEQPVQINQQFNAGKIEIVDRFLKEADETTT